MKTGMRQLERMLLKDLQPVPNYVRLGESMFVIQSCSLSHIQRLLVTGSYGSERLRGSTSAQQLVSFSLYTQVWFLSYPSMCVCVCACVIVQNCALVSVSVR